MQLKNRQDVNQGESNKGGRTVGIDLGTTFSAIAHIDDFGKPEIMPNAENERITPSMILFDGPNAIVGRVAQQNAVAEPEKIVDFIKREMGKNKAMFNREFDGRQYSAEELSALIIRKLVTDAERFLQEPIKDAVITVPAYFNDAERTATISAGQLAGLNVLQVINEPTAAALAYGLDKLDRDQTVFVFDLGGGTFDVTIMRIENRQMRMVASNGDHRLGGKDWDDVILHWAAEEFEKAYGDNPLLDLQSYQDLHSRSQIAKVQLSARGQTTLVHSYKGKSIKLQLTREDFEERCAHLLGRCKALCEIVMEEAGLDWSALDTILLTGGMTRMPSVRKLIQDLAPGVPVNAELSPDEAVARGAAIQATLCKLRKQQREEVQAGDDSKSSTIVRVQFSDGGGQVIHVTEITTHTLGVVLWDNTANEEYVFPMIRKSSALPVAMKDSFGLSRSDIRKATVRIVEGESTVPRECTALGHCEIDLPPDLPKGTPVQVTYCYDESQVLEVLVEVAGRRSCSVINRNAGLTESELQAAAADLYRINVT
ncbi:MAG: Hsp70 family protein [Chthoniobacteraceae bacterium]